MVRVRELVDGEPDDFGNPVPTWVEGDWPVSGIAPGAMDEPGQSNRDLSVVVWTLYGPKSGGYPKSSQAEVMVPFDGEWFPVNGHPKDWTLGPWSHPTAGIVVELRRADN